MDTHKKAEREADIIRLEDRLKLTEVLNKEKK